MDTSNNLRDEFIALGNKQVHNLCDLWQDMFDSQTYEIYLRRLFAVSMEYQQDILKETLLLKEQLLLATMESKTSDMDIIADLEQTTAATRNISLEKIFARNNKEVNEIKTETEEMINQLTKLNEIVAEVVDVPLQKERTSLKQRQYDLQEIMQNDKDLLATLPPSAEVHQLIEPPKSSLTPSIFDNMYALYYCVLHHLVIYHQVVQKHGTQTEHYVFANQAYLRAQQEICKLDNYFDAVRMYWKQRYAKNLTIFIKNLRKRIHDLWQLTYKSQAERELFVEFHNEDYNMELVIAHEREVCKLEKLYLNNQQLFKLYAARSVLWQQLKQLYEGARHDAASVEYILQKERKRALRKKIRFYEKHITQLVDEFRVREEAKFYINGREILAHMHNDWVYIHIQSRNQSLS